MCRPGMRYKGPRRRPALLLDRSPLLLLLPLLVHYWSNSVSALQVPASHVVQVRAPSGLHSYLWSRSTGQGRHYAAASGVDATPIAVKRTPLPARELPDFVCFKGAEFDPIRTRRFHHSLINFIRRAIEAWGPEPPIGGKRWKRRPSGAMEWARFLQAAWEEKKYLTLSSLALVGAAFCEVSVPHYSSMALNAVLVGRDLVVFREAVQMLVMLGCTASALTFIRAAMFGLAGTRVATRARVELLKSLLTQELGFFDTKDSGELTNRLSADCAKLSSVISSHINVMLRQTLQLLGGSYYLFRLEPTLAWVTLVGVTAMGILTAVHGAFIKRMGRRSQDALAQANAVAGQILGLIRVIRSHGSEEKELGRYGSELRRTVDMLETHDLGHSVYRSLVRLLQTGLQATVMSLGAVYTLQGRMTGEHLTTFLFYVNFVSAASFDVGDRWTSIQDAIGSTASVFALTDRIPRLKIRTDLRHHPRRHNHHHHHHHDESANATHHFAGGNESMAHTTHQEQEAQGVGAGGVSATAAAVPTGRVVFRNVTFAYPLRGAVPVLRNLNLQIPPGRRTAIVGGSGAGKSTLLRLLCRFYDPDQGAVLLDGRDVRALTQQELTRRVVFLPQEPQLMPISIAQNIAYGLDERTTTMEQVMQAAKEANVHDFIASLPNGYATRVGENSVSLSGGQKQRIAVARALIRRPEVMLLDEPTSALDVESEKVVAEALDLASRGRTVVIIAHRLQTIKNVDWIIAMEDGRVVEEGTHKSLKEQRGAYYHMLETLRKAMD